MWFGGRVGSGFKMQFSAIGREVEMHVQTVVYVLRETSLQEKPERVRAKTLG